MYIRWADAFGVLRYWVGDCDLKYFPGDNPDAAIIDKEGYDKKVSRRCKQVERFVYGE